jgi:hypoxanthine phosphoribosyltransferase
MHQESTKIILNAGQIQERIHTLAQEIAADYQGKQVILVGILKGSVIFLADLIRELWQAGLTDCEVDFMGISSYGHDTESSQNPHITKDLDTDISHRHVLIVEDIIDTGHSLDALLRMLSQRGAISIKTIVLLSKQSRRAIDIPVDYTGFEIEGWVEGYGLDTKELYRGRPDVVEVIA